MVQLVGLLCLVYTFLSVSIVFPQCIVNLYFFCYSLDCREGHMKKNRLCVCLCVCIGVKRTSGSKEHRLKGQWSEAFDIGLSTNQIFSAWKFSQSGVFDIELSTNQISSAWNFSELYDFDISLSTNQIFSAWKFSQSGIFDIGLSTNQILSPWKFNQSGIFDKGLSTNQIVPLCNFHYWNVFQNLGFVQSGCENLDFKPISILWVHSLFNQILRSSCFSINIICRKQRGFHSDVSLTWI